MHIQKSPFISPNSRKAPQSHKRRGRLFWSKTIKEFEESPLSLKGFCAERTLAVSTFHGWRRRLSKGKVPNQQSAKASSKPKPHFLPIYVRSPEAPLKKPKHPDISSRPQPVSKNDAEKPLDHLSDSSSGLSIYLNKGLKISIDKEFHEPTLQRLVQICSPTGPETC